MNARRPTTCSLEPILSACLLALSRSDRRVLALLLVRVDCPALCCLVLGVVDISDDAGRRIYVSKKTDKNEKMGKEGSSKTEKKKQRKRALSGK